MADTSIEWTDKTWNPVVGCDRISPGCAHCYAKDLHDKRHKAHQAGKAMPAQYAHPFEVVQLMADRLDDPLSWRAPKRVFVNSVSDLFHDDVPDEFIVRCFAVMLLTQRHTYQVLTKRPERMRRIVGAPNFGECVYDMAFDMSHMWGRGGLIDGVPERDGAPPNVWLGVSVENQKHGLPRIEYLRRVPAAVRFLSVEPLLEDLGPIDLAGIQWVICGGESGRGARPMHPAWARRLRDQCQAAGVPFFFKQWGEWAPLPEPFHYTPAFGSGNAEYVRALSRYEKTHGCTRLLDDRPEGWGATMVRDGTCITDGGLAIGDVGKKAAGRLLDGRLWDEFPAPAEAAT